jgi:molybdopterin/thiamine biosynthesis adenylyltransferase/rhodanese-related sulfurtransferase
MLNEQEKYRYSRQIILDNVKEAGQERLKNSRVLVIGAGGLGCPVLLYLAGSGIGHIGIMDHDTVDESNLHRQVLFTQEDCGKLKAVAAEKRLRALNPYIDIESMPVKLTAQNARDIFKKYDLIVDGTDNFSARYIINDAGVLENKPIVYGALFKFEGQVTVFNYQNGPTYRCLFPEPPRQAPNCNEAGVLGFLPGIIGLYMVNEVIKICLGVGTVLSGKLQIYNGLNSELMSLTISKNTTLKINAMQSDYESSTISLCGFDKLNIREIDSEKLNDLIQTETTFLDVREAWESPRIHSPNMLEIPLDQIERRVDEIPKNKQVIVFCKSGGRSKLAIHLLTKHFGYKNLYNLKDGIKNYHVTL